MLQPGQKTGRTMVRYDGNGERYLVEEVVVAEPECMEMHSYPDGYPMASAYAKVRITTRWFVAESRELC